MITHNHTFKSFKCVIYIEILEKLDFRYCSFRHPYNPYKALKNVFFLFFTKFDAPFYNKKQDEIFFSKEIICYGIVYFTLNYSNKKFIIMSQDY